ncbi:hypothetical protein O0L34_g11924 [Tuta absoluta]|nr:hypothetical protein O0L34_g11924 [Tuta absoluta]
MASEPDRERLFGRCRCCLSFGYHEDIEVLRKIFLKTFNLLLATNLELTNKICTLCINRLNDAMDFKAMVLESENELLRCLNKNSNYDLVNVVQSNDEKLQQENFNTVIKQEDAGNQILKDNEEQFNSAKNEKMVKIEHDNTHNDNDVDSDDTNTEESLASDDIDDDIGKNITNLEEDGKINKMITSCDIAVDNQIITHEIVIDEGVQHEKFDEVDRKVTNVEEDSYINKVKDEMVTRKDSDDVDVTNMEDSLYSDDIDDQINTQEAPVDDQTIEQSLTVPEEQYENGKQNGGNSNNFPYAIQMLQYIFL